MVIKNIIVLSLLTFTTAVLADPASCPSASGAVSINHLLTELNQNTAAAKKLGRPADQLRTALQYSQNPLSSQVAMQTDQAMKGFIDAAQKQGLDQGALQPLVYDLKTYRAAYKKCIS